MEIIPPYLRIYQQILLAHHTFPLTLLIFCVLALFTLAMSTMDPSITSSIFLPYKRLPDRLVRGEGVYLYDDKVKRYLDMLAGIAVIALGYKDPELTQAICNQAKELLHISNLFENPWQEDFPQRWSRENPAQRHLPPHPLPKWHL